MTPVRLHSLRLRPLLVALALAAVTVSPTQAASTSLHDFLKPAKPLDPEAAKEKRKTAARLEAEKQRALRETKEKEAAAQGGASASAAPKPSELDDLDDLDEPKAKTPAEPSTQAAHAEPVVAARYSSEASMAIEEAVRRSGLSAETAARTTGLMIGAAGTTLFSYLTPPQEEGSALELLAQDASISNLYALEQDYASAERIGKYLRYGFFAALAGAALLAGLRILFRNRPRRSRLYVTQEERNSMPTFSLARLFGKRPADTATETTAGEQPISVDIPMVQDYAVNLLFARGRHDLTGCRDMVTTNLAGILERYFRTCESRGHWNKVERVSNLTCQQLETWVDGDIQFARLHVSWQALDYVVNFNRKPQDPGYVYEGNPKTLDHFSEDWTVLRRPGEGWVIDTMCPAAGPAPAR